ncbi:MAG: RlmE family RNA methyltransferase [Holosporaceae bacterium]|jgi:23S rRNA (uridine2552-2'-O)-methyltransferase|nr:RlmE family RNA methyltransferase [Holosporaceae bacterium]
MRIKGKRSLSSRRWLDRQLQDPYVKRAQREGYRCRAAFKLMEIDDKFRLIKNAKYMIDLGAAPGGWCQVLSQRSSADAKISAIDLLQLEAFDKIQLFRGDFKEEDNQRALLNYLGQKPDLIVSDMAPPTIGHAKTEHIQIMELVENAYVFTANVLQINGSFVAKIFQGGREKSFLELLQKNFREVCFFKPKSSRNLSAEIYIVATGFKKCN